jgi:hypothetical protein
MYMKKRGSYHIPYHIKRGLYLLGDFSDVQFHVTGPGPYREGVPNIMGSTLNSLAGTDGRHIYVELNYSGGRGVSAEALRKCIAHEMLHLIYGPTAPHQNWCEGGRTDRCHIFEYRCLGYGWGEHKSVSYIEAQQFQRMWGRGRHYGMRIAQMRKAGIPTWKSNRHIHPIVDYWDDHVSPLVPKRRKLFKVRNEFKAERLRLIKKFREWRDFVKAKKHRDKQHLEKIRKAMADLKRRFELKQKQIAGINKQIAELNKVINPAFEEMKFIVNKYPNHARIFSWQRQNLWMPDLDGEPLPKLRTEFTEFPKGMILCDLPMADSVE